MLSSILIRSILYVEHDQSVFIIIDTFFICHAVGSSALQALHGSPPLAANQIPLESPLRTEGMAATPKATPKKGSLLVPPLPTASPQQPGDLVCTLSFSSYSGAVAIIELDRVYKPGLTGYNVPIAISPGAQRDGDTDT